VGKNEKFPEFLKIIGNIEDFFGKIKVFIK